jgi:hypothetical protein
MNPVNKILGYKKCVYCNQECWRDTNMCWHHNKLFNDKL